MKKKVLGVCGGNGVILRPFRKNLLGNVEPRSLFHTKNQEQWKLNFGDIPYMKTVHESSIFKEGGVDIIVGAPDCGHSSVLAYSRAKGFSDPRKNHSLNVYAESVNFHKPELWLMENLPALLKQIKIKEIELMIPGYKIITLQESVSEWGNSQKNKS